MKISVVIPTYNGEKFIEQTLISVLNQSRPADEIIISDDNSSDATVEICKRIKNNIQQYSTIFNNIQQYSTILKIYQNSKGPSGFVEGWNNATQYAQCEYVSILHQDDILAPTFLEEIEKAHNLYPDAKHLVSCCNYIDVNGKVVRESTHLTGQVELLSGKDYSDIYILKGYDHINRCPGVVDHIDIFSQCRYRPEAGHIADDDFFIRVGNYTDIVCIHKPLAFYREHSSSETGHLENIELTLRLLKCHYFQIGEFGNNPLLSDKAKLYLRKEESKYIRRLIIYALKYRRSKYFFEGLKFLIKTTVRDRARNLPLLLSTS